jgi:hypothetical protein
MMKFAARYSLRESNNSKLSSENIWRQAAAENVTGRTYQSMREHWRKHLFDVYLTKKKTLRAAMWLEDQAGGKNKG